MVSIIREESIESGGYAPFQADFVDMDNYSYYARFRHGSFTLKKNLFPTGPYHAFDHKASETIFRKSYTDGFVDLEELKRITSHLLVWPVEIGILRICKKRQIV